MVLNYNTIDKIDALVMNGLNLGYYNTQDDLTKLPTSIGDWLIKTMVNKHSANTGIIIALPTNKRTRLIYQKGRIKWLVDIGYHCDLAVNYLKACKGIDYRWDIDVARFVNERLNMDDWIIEEVLSSESPRQTFIENGIYTNLNNNRLVAVCKIIQRLKTL